MTADLDDFLADLTAFPAGLGRLLRRCPDGGLDFTPGDWTGSPGEALNVRQQVCHLRDIEIDGYQKRFARVLSESHPLLPSIDGITLATERRYDQTPVDAAFDAFAAARANTVRMLQSLKAPELARTGEFEGIGAVTLGGLVHFLASHDLQHLSGIEWLIGKFECARHFSQ